MDTTLPSTIAPFTIRPAHSGSDLKRFIEFPYQFYKEYPYWVGPLQQDISHALNPKKNAFFEHGHIDPFIAVDASGQVIGRIAAIKNGMHLKKYEDGNGFFGFFECVQRYEVAEALLDAARKRLNEQGLTGMRGPANPSLNDTAGLLVNGYDREPSIMMPYNPPYYQDYLLRYGFQRAMTMWAYYIHKKYVNMDRVRRGAEMVARRNPTITVRTMDMKRYTEEAKTILHIYNEAWSNNWGHVPMTEAEFAQITGAMKQVVDPSIVFLLEDAGTPVAFSITLPNLNEAIRHVKDGKLFPTGLPKLLTRTIFGSIYDCRTLLMGVLPQYHGRSLDILLHHALLDVGLQSGYGGTEMSWVLDSNSVLLNSVKSLGGVVDKEYALFEKRF